ncbi:hypothetical protein [Microcoleus sp.]|uniref:hypothetical protein n=1 Tax=Microcoleus sp. TaxID=44472 RepID=UPI00403EE49E
MSCEAVIVSSESTLHSLHRIKQFPGAVMERFTAIETARIVSHERAKAALGTHLPNFFRISDAIDAFSQYERKKFTKKHYF